MSVSPRDNGWKNKNTKEIQINMYPMHDAKSVLGVGGRTVAPKMSMPQPLEPMTKLVYFVDVIKFKALRW